jgi:phosphate butyryltransferase
MKTIQELYSIIEKQEKIKKLSVAVAQDAHALSAVIEAKNRGYIIPFLVGDEAKIRQIATDHALDLTNTHIINETNEAKAVQKAVELVSTGQADILMKGYVATGTLLKAVLNPDWGLRKAKVLSHLAFYELPTYHKLLALTDVAMNIAPDLAEKVEIINNSVSFMNSIGITNPKVAVIGAVETVSDKMPATIDAAILSKMQDRNQIANCIVDGPFALDNAISKESAEHKKIVSPVAGDADLLVFPNIEAGNVLYKALAFLMESKSAALILGAKAPIVLTSRSDSEETKLNSIVLAAAAK